MIDKSVDRAFEDECREAFEVEFHQQEKEAVKRALVRWFRDTKDRLELNNHEVSEILYDVGEKLKEEGLI